ncbi:T9SS type A sorting domain-containing protein [Rufibacter hautae]|uniref:T9SS type A sorting domain-containing protein n=1 Tax=Rufibacter hautae TaxID=2595005 RepID=UPI0016818251|nr:T9SS type A sorting domain-containing protein [Rufibacter hautae]
MAKGRDRTYEFDGYTIGTPSTSTLVLAADGTVYIYHPYYPQEYYVAEVPVLTNVKSIAVGYHRYYAVEADGSVYEWGGIYEGNNIPVQIQGLSNIKTVASGGYHALALDEAGNVFAWEDGGAQLDYFYSSNGVDLQSIRKVWGPGAKAIAAGDWHSLLIGADNMVYEWGYHRSTEGRHPEYPTRQTFWYSPLPIKKVQGIEGAKAIAAGLFTSQAYGTDGKVYSWEYVQKEFSGLFLTPSLEFIPYIYYEYNSSYAAVEVPDPFPANCVNPVVSFIASPAALGSPTIFTDLSTNVAPGAVYAWDFDGDGTADSHTKGNVSFTFPSPGTHTAKLTISNGICEQTHSAALTVSAPVTSDARWDFRYGGTGNDRLHAMAKADDGGFLLGGTSSSTGNGDKTEASRGGRDFWLVKVSATGVKLWDKRYGGFADDELRTITPTPDGGFLLGGSSRSGTGGDKSEVSRGGTDFWVVKIAGDGTKLWNRRFGGAGDEDLRAVTIASDGGFLLGGSSASGIGGDQRQASRGLTDYWVVRISANGTKQWDKRFGGSAADELHSLVQTPDGGFLLGGQSMSGMSGDKAEASRGLSDFWVVRISGTGAQLWDRRFGGAAEDRLRTVTLTSDGGFLLGGSSLSGAGGDKSEVSRGGQDLWVVRINSAGAKLWNRRFGGSSDEELTSVLETPEGNLLLGGSSASGVGGDRRQASQGSTDYWVVQVSGTGDKQWDKRFGGAAADGLQSIVIAGDGGLLLGGISSSGTGGDHTQPGRGLADFWIVKVGGPIPSQAPIHMTSSIQESPVAQGPENGVSALLANPNPFGDKVHLRFSLTKADRISLRVYDERGREVASLYEGPAEAGTHSVEWLAFGQKSGVYFVRLATSAGKSIHRKVVLIR